MVRRVCLAFVCIAVVLASSPARAIAAEPTHVRVLVPDADNLQYLAFWVAMGAGYFDDEHLAIDLAIPSKPSLAQSQFTRGDAEVAVLSPPMYLRLIAEHFPLVLVANLLQNDPINLIVRRSVAVERGIDLSASIKDRLTKMKGLRIGVAHGPPTRLRVLFASQGLDADRDVSMISIHGADQNDAFGEKKVDALYAHTPYLETALVDQDAIVVVDQAGGELPELAARQIHALVVTRAFADGHAPIVTAMVRAIARAERLVHGDHAATVDAVLRALPAYDRGRVAKLVELYDPAVPATPRVSADGFVRALALYPAGLSAPDLSAIDGRAFVAPQFADAVSGSESARRRPWILYGLILGGVVLALALALREAFFSARREEA